MAKDVFKLTDTEIRKAEVKDKNYKLSDGGGLYVLIKPTGGKYFRFDYRFAGQRLTLAMGTYPETTLKAAREKLKAAKEQLNNNINPSQTKKLEKAKAIAKAANTFDAVALDWWNRNKSKWKEHHAARILGRLEADVFSPLSATPIADIKAPQIKSIINKIESRDALDVAKRVLQDIKRVFSYAVELGLVEFNPAREITSQSRETKHRHPLPASEIPQFFVDLEAYSKKARAYPLTTLAIEFLLVTFVRSGDLRGAKWSEINMQEKVWQIPAHRMKMKTDHFVPLTDQAIELLERARIYSNHSDLIFPSEIHPKKPISENTMRQAMIRMGYDGKHIGKSKAVPHGLRTTACSILNEHGFNRDAIERQMSHQERNGVRAAYIHQAQFKNQRYEMMQWWANHLDALKAQGANKNVVAGSFGKQVA